MGTYPLPPPGGLHLGINSFNLFFFFLINQNIQDPVFRHNKADCCMNLFIKKAPYVFFMCCSVK
jgi:hypothetical protein